MPKAFQYVSGKLSRLLETPGDVGQTCGSTREISPAVQTTNAPIAVARTIHITR